MNLRREEGTGGAKGYMYPPGRARPMDGRNIAFLEEVVHSLLSPCLLNTVALSSKKVDNLVQCFKDDLICNNQRLLSSTLKLAVLLEDEPDNSIHN